MEMSMSTFRCTIVLTALLAMMMPRAAVGGCDNYDLRVVLKFAKPNAAYSAVCTAKYPGPLTIAITNGERVVRRFILNTLTQPIDVRSIRLQARRSPDVQGVFVQCSGGSAYHDYVFEVSAHSAKQLMYGLDKGGVDYGYDSKGRLTGMRFHYRRWHMDTESGIRGHVLTAIDYKWVPRRQAFQKGRVHVDCEAEQQASLLDLLSEIGSDQFLPVAYVTNANHYRIAYYYRPTGILRGKTPPALRDVPKVKVEVRYEERKTNYGHEQIPHIVSISRAAAKGAD
jgi:hypothetical protein